MALTPEEVRHIATLARVGVSDEDVRKFQEQLSQILDYFQVLNAIDTTDVPPTAHTLLLHNVMRDDAAGESLPPEQALANAPQRDDSYFRVSSILEE
ncbi:MAG TPA: Asp-tRNA(Asn)/Glu-tRNA(Gln) amidotransferase subunit GatC [Dehalococcoidia bacterium]|nr:Asp-tRNA(Asn)/Glu-tRNA(Gln) amidotransferase subunit GatC [Dehalococcoidia bacterium]